MPNGDPRKQIFLSHSHTHDRFLYSSKGTQFIYMFFVIIMQWHMSRDMIFPSMWYVRPAKPQISLRIRAVWSEPLLVAWIFYDSYATDWTALGVSKLNRRLQRLVRVYTCQNATLLIITCRGSYIYIPMKGFCNWSISDIQFSRVKFSKIQTMSNKAAILFGHIKTSTMFLLCIYYFWCM